MQHLKLALHRHLWQRLPQQWRRAALFRATALTAPRPSANALPRPPILAAGALRTTSGLGQSARLCHDALEATGVEVLGVDLSADLMQPLDMPGYQFTDGSRQEGPGTLILHVNSPLVPLAIWRLGRRFVRNKYIVGYWSWELPDVPPDWRHSVPFVHEIWVPSTFTAGAMQPIAAGRPVRVVPLPVRLNRPQSANGARTMSRPFTVLTIFNMASSFARKNPLAAIAAFRAAFADDRSARLIVKTSNSSAFPGGMDQIRIAIGAAENIDLVDSTLSAAELDELYLQSDVLMSLHRSEGFGLTIAEAMLRGLPVVATNWSGSTDFLDAECGIPIPFRLIPAEDPQGTYHHPSMNWAEADVEAASMALRRLRSDPELARRLGSAGRAFASRTWSAESFVDAVRRHLRL